MADNRKLYKKRKDARAFLEEHPKLAGYEVEQVISGFYRDFKTLKEADPAKVAKADFIMEGLHFYPDGDVKKALSLYYFEHASISKIQKALKKSNKNATVIFLHRAKKQVEVWFKAFRERTIEFTSADVKERKVIDRGDGRSMELFLVFDDYTQELIWVNKEGKALPPDVQDLLEGEGFVEWDYVNLKR